MTQLEKLSLVLSEGNWHSTVELAHVIGHRFSAAIYTAIRGVDTPLRSVGGTIDSFSIGYCPYLRASR
jgi:hypothetical protein